MGAMSAFAGCLGLRLLMRRHPGFLMDHGGWIALIAAVAAAILYLRMKRLEPEMRAFLIGLATAISGAGGYAWMMKMIAAWIPGASAALQRAL